MSKDIDIHVLELMASKICHDLISPVGAVNNGVEFLEEMGAEAGEEITGLIAFSAQQASAKLQAFRMAYGAGGGDSGIKPEDVHKTFEAVISADGKIKQDWDPFAPIGPEILPKGFCKILMSCLLLACECLPKGGTISVTKGESGGTIIKAEGENAGMKEKALEALALQTSTENLGPKVVHSYITGIMAKNYGFKVFETETGDNFTVISLNPRQ